ncbi:MAG: hypothetical protein JNM14_07015 [Ferruginibacter sp.]|nr:hypothetical protein [Ferruginibacter sp.]
MNIDQGTLLTAIFFVLLFSIPFILLNISHRKRVKQNLQVLNLEAAKFNLSITKFNTWGNTCIGIDETANVVFFTKKTTQGKTALQVTLAETGNCRIANIKRTGYDGTEHYSITGRLALVFEARDKSKAETAFPFYDIEYDGGMLTGELQQAEKWCNIINDKIASIAQKK